MTHLIQILAEAARKAVAERPSKSAFLYLDVDGDHDEIDCIEAQWMDAEPSYAKGRGIWVDADLSDDDAVAFAKTVLGARYLASVQAKDAVENGWAAA